MNAVQKSDINISTVHYLLDDYSPVPDARCACDQTRPCSLWAPNVAVIQLLSPSNRPSTLPSISSAHQSINQKQSASSPFACMRCTLCNASLIQTPNCARKADKSKEEQNAVVHCPHPIYNIMILVNVSLSSSYEDASHHSLPDYSLPDHV